MRWHLADDTLAADGEFTFKQSDLGLEPYTGLLGALRVADAIRAKVHIVGVRF